MPGLLEWTSLIFTIPLLVGVLLVVGTALGLADFGGDVDAELDADSDLDVDVDADGEVDSPELDAEHEPHVLHGALEIIGFGRVPLSLLAIVTAFLFGGLGTCTTIALGELVPHAGWRAVAALVVASVGTFILAGAVARFVSRFVPSTETYAGTQWDLLGTSGVAELDIDPHFGLANVRDTSGSLIKIRCRSYGATIPKGSEVLVTDYDSERDMYQVELSPL